MTRELHTLLLSYSVVFLDRELTAFRQMYAASDPKRLLRLATYHAVRPVLYQALKKAGMDAPLTRRLQLFALQVALRDTLNGKETVRLLKLLNEAGIEALPYKGYLFTEKIYRGQHFRESGDIDIVIRHKQEAAKAIALLVADGYELHSPVDGDELISHAPGQEVSLTTKRYAGPPLHLDFHWGVNERYHIYPITTDDFFKGATVQHFAGEELLLPAEEALFKMLLNHHGGRGCWLKLKEMFDFALFLSRSEETGESLSEWASAVKMDKVFRTGKYLSCRLTPSTGLQRWKKEERAILQFWEKGESYDKDLWLKMKKMRVYLELQNPEVSKLQLLKRYAFYHGTDTPLYEKYYRPFGGRSNALNFVVKMGTIFYKGVRGPYK